MGLAAVGCAAQVAVACQCGSVPRVAPSLAASDAAFVGQVVELWPASRTVAGRRVLGQRLTIRVARRLKGAGGAAEVVFDPGGSCAYAFERGASYLIFAFAGEDGGGLVTRPCVATQPLGRLEPGEAAALDDGAGIPRSAAPLAPEPVLHLVARRGWLAALVAVEGARAVWTGWGETPSGAVLRLAARLAAAAALPVLVWLLAGRRRRLAVFLFVGLPAFVVAAVLAWAYHVAVTNPFLAALVR